MLMLKSLTRHIAAIFVFCACCSALAGDYPPLPKVERTRLTDEEFFGKLDPAFPAMKAVLATLKSDGVQAAKSALADHFRHRTSPRWWIDPHARPAHDARPAGVRTSKADQALRHIYRGFEFGLDIDWLDNPTYAPGREFDKEWSMAFLRMPWWDDLGTAYWATGDEKYAQEFVRQFHDFVTKHPIPVKRTGGSKHPLKYAVPEWRTLEIGNRLSGSWTNAYFRFLSSPSMDDATICEMLKSFWEMGHHLELYSSVREVSSNWLVFETRGLHTVATLFPEFADAARWLTLSEQRLTEELTKQVYPDGVQWELAPGYGAGVLQAFRRANQLGMLNGRSMPSKYVATLENMFDYFAYSSIQGQMAAFSDSGHGSVRRLLSDGFEDFPKRSDFQWIATGGRAGDKPLETNRVFPYAGHYVMRSGWDPDQRFMIVDAGPFGTNHQHEDALSFELSAYGERLITDPGTYRYNYDSPWRKFMVSSLAHNTLAVDRQGQCRRERRDTWIAKAPVPNVWKPGEDLTYLRGDYTSGYGDGGKIRVTHTRSVFFVDGRYWVIFDRARPDDQDEHLYESIFMLDAPNAVAESSRIVTHRDGANLVIVAAEVEGQTVDVVKGQMEPVRRGWKRGGETVQPNPTAVVAQRRSGPVTFAFLLYPVVKGAPIPQATIEFVPVRGGIDPIAVRVKLPDGRPRVLVDQLGDGEVVVDGIGKVAAPGVK